MSAKVLVVDDDAFIRRPLEYILREEGFAPFTAVDGEDCLKKVAETRPDLIILDVMMPGADGIATCRRLKADRRTARIPVIMLTARSSRDDRLEGTRAGADAYVTKPFSPARLVAAVRDLLGSPNP